MKLALNDLIPICQSRVENLFAIYIRDKTTPAGILQEAMSYGVYNGGKRIRPLLVYATGLALNTPLENLDAAACAVELIHSYSLIHDDLPAMDNADLRRGKPACHKVCGDAMAILAGDAMQALAFQVIAMHPTPLTPAQRMDMIQVLGEAAGPMGMAGGQALDITAMDQTITLDKLLLLYKLKTGALLSASVKLGMLSANTALETEKAALEKYADCLGLAFQIQDDLLDMEGTTSALGKPQGIDAANNKMTYPVLCGIEKTKLKIQELTELALQSVGVLGNKGQILVELAESLLSRVH
jgi:geranylgeranyl pyrophosphate synthase